MRNKLYKLIVMTAVMLFSVSNISVLSYADNELIQLHASDYIISYRGTAKSKSAGSIYLSADMSVMDVSCQITAEIYKNGSFYDDVIKSTSNDDLSLVKTISVPSGSYYVLYKYQATLNEKVVETKTIKTSTFTVK